MFAPSPAAAARDLRLLLDRPGPLTLGVEEEITLTHPQTLVPVALAPEALARLAGDSRFCGELPADQIELRTAPLDTAAEVETALTEGRVDLVEALGRLATPAAAGVHPLAPERIALSTDPRYSAMREEYGPVAERQVVCGLHVHVRLPGAERSLAVYNTLRSYLPELAALAANAPFHRGRDTGFASIRPKISEGLPRQGIPPAFDSIDHVADDWRWERRTRPVETKGQWWWELRLHPQFGTIEVRVADQQITAAESAALAAVVHTLVAELGARFDAGLTLPVHATWRIEQNRWTAARHGLDGTLANLDTGEPEAARRRVARLLSELEKAAGLLGAAEQFRRAGELCEFNGAERQRAVPGGGAQAAASMLAESFATPAGVEEGMSGEAQPA